jgi:hypothetical protein
MEGFKKIEMPSLGGMVALPPTEKIPFGFAVNAKNVRIKGGVVSIRGGLRRTLSVPEAYDTSSLFSGMGQVEDQDGAKHNLFFTSDGELFEETSNGSEALAPVINPPAFEVGVYAEMASAYGRMFMAFSDLQTPDGTPYQFLKSSYDGNFYVDPIGLPPNETPPTTAVEEGVGNIDVGTRNAVVLAFTRTGYVAGATFEAILSFDITSPDQKLRVTGIPTFPQANVIKRVVAFTLAGGSTSGPWFYILEDDQVDSVVITKTVIDDNVTTTALFNFNDEYLVGLGDVTEDIFDVAVLEPQVGIYFNKSLKRLMAWGADNSTIKVSEPDDPETFRVSKGFVQVGPMDGQKTVAVREYKTETIFFKDNSGYSLIDGTLAPSEWNVPRRWEGSGPLSPRAIDTEDSFLAYAARQGLMIYQGDVPWTASEFVRPMWARINWDAGFRVWVVIDHVNNEIKVGVPLDQALYPSHIFIFDYSDGLKKMKFSYDDIGAFQAVWFQRDLPTPPNPDDYNPQALKGSQLLFASGVQDGTIHILDPTSRSDNGQGIDQRYEPSYVRASDSGGVITFGGIDVNAKGAGRLYVQEVALRNGEEADPADIAPTRPIALTNKAKLHHRGGSQRHCEKTRVVLHNGGVAGSYFELHGLTSWINGAFESVV